MSSLTLHERQLPMRVEIKARADLTDDESMALTNLSHAVYPPDEEFDDGASQIQWSGSMWRVLLWDDNEELVTHIGMLTRYGLCDKASVLIGGMGGVHTHPKSRRKGYAGIALGHAAKFLRDEQHVDFSLLVCRDGLIPYYARFGWQCFVGEMLVQQESGQVKFTYNKPMVLAGNKPVPECDVIDLCGKPW